MAHAHERCDRAGYKMTELREQVLSIIVNAEKPIGAYEIMAELETVSDRVQVAPPTVYRTLDFLLERGLVNRIHTLNAFLPKQLAHQDTLSSIFICRRCGYFKETPINPVQQSLNLAANELKFQIENQTLEVLGCCQDCRTEKSDDV